MFRAVKFATCGFVFLALGADTLMPIVSLNGVVRQEGDGALQQTHAASGAAGPDGRGRPDGPAHVGLHSRPLPPTGRPGELRPLQEVRVPQMSCCRLRCIDKRWGIGIGKYSFFGVSVLVGLKYTVSVLVLVSVNIGIFWGISKNNTDPPSLVSTYIIPYISFYFLRLGSSISLQRV